MHIDYMYLRIKRILFHGSPNSAFMASPSPSGICGTTPASLRILLLSSFVLHASSSASCVWVADELLPDTVCRRELIILDRLRTVTGVVWSVSVRGLTILPNISGYNNNKVHLFVCCYVYYASV